MDEVIDTGKDIDIDIDVDLHVHRFMLVISRPFSEANRGARIWVRNRPDSPPQKYELTTFGVTKLTTIMLFRSTSLTRK